MTKIGGSGFGSGQRKAFAGAGGIPARFPDNDLPRRPDNKMLQAKSIGTSDSDRVFHLGGCRRKKQKAAGHEAVAIDPKDQGRRNFASICQQGEKGFGAAKRKAAAVDGGVGPMRQLLAEKMKSLLVHSG
ncbi:MAG: hypothetical protein WDA20_07815 [Desulfuromonadales bacterium]